MIPDLIVEQHIKRSKEKEREIRKFRNGETWNRARILGKDTSFLRLQKDSGPCNYNMKDADPDFLLPTVTK